MEGQESRLETKMAVHLGTYDEEEHKYADLKCDEDSSEDSIVVGSCSKHEKIFPVPDLHANDDKTGPSLPSFWQMQPRTLPWLDLTLQTLFRH